MIRILTAMPFVAVIYLLIATPLLGMYTGQNGFRIFWPIAAVIAVIIAIANRRRLDLRVFQSTPILCLIVLLLFIGASYFWSFSPKHTMTAWILQLIVLFTTILPFTVLQQPGDMIKRLHLCCLAAMVVASTFVLTVPPMMSFNGEVLGHPGHFYHKQYLGSYASITMLLAFHELLYPGRRRWIASVSIALCFWLLLESKSKTSYGFLLAAPCLASIILWTAIKFRVPIAIGVLLIPATYFSLAAVIHNIPYRIAYRLTGDPTFTGRALIWDYIEKKASQYPWLGWGYSSFWQDGSTSPALSDAPGFVAFMASSHSGYLEVRLQTGYLGLLLLIVFLVATFHALDHIKRTNTARCWILLTLGLFIAFINLLDSYWLVPFDLGWLLFVIIAADAARMLRSEESQNGSQADNAKRGGNVNGAARIRKLRARHSRSWPSRTKGPLRYDARRV